MPLPPHLGKATGRCHEVRQTGACDADQVMSERGFRLPDGDPQSGREVFLYLQCNQCHTIKSEELPIVPGTEPYVELGGVVTHVKTYGELVTAIVNPSHKLADGFSELATPSADVALQ